MIFFLFYLLETFYFNQKIIIYFYLIIFLFKWIRNFEDVSSRKLMKESFVEMKVQEEVKVLRNNLEMNVAPMIR